MTFRCRNLTPKPLLTLPLDACEMRVWAPDYVETCFPDGRTCQSVFVDDEDARRHAAEWGYSPNEVWRMHLDHELVHTLLAQATGLPWSPVLYHVAGGTHVPADKRLEEEGRVVAVQRVLERIVPLVGRYREVTNR